MNISRRLGYIAKSAAISIGVGIAVLSILLAAIGFLVAALFIWIERHNNPAIAAAITAGAMLGLAIVIGLFGAITLRQMRKRQPSMVSEFTGLAALVGRVIGTMVRRDPKKAMVISVIIGALAEYVTAERKK